MPEVLSYEFAFATFTWGDVTKESHVRFIGNRIRDFHLGGCDEGVPRAFRTGDHSLAVIVIYATIGISSLRGNAPGTKDRD